MASRAAPTSRSRPTATAANPTTRWSPRSACRRSPTSDGTGLSFIAPAAGLGRALDVAFPDYQPTGQDFLAAWSVAGGGQLRPGFPQAVNDLQFLTGPSVADLERRCLVRRSSREPRAWT